MRERTSETSAQPSQAQAQAQATSAPSNHHHVFASAPPLDQHGHHQPHREPTQHHYVQEPPTQGSAFAQHAYTSSDPMYYQQNFPVAPPSYYHNPDAFPHDEYVDYEDYEDYEDYDDDEDDDDEDMDMSDSDGGVPLGNVTSASGVMSPVPDSGPVFNHPETHPGISHTGNYPYTSFENHLSPTAPPAHMTSYWSVGPVFDPAGPIHPTPLNTISFHPMLNGGGMEDDDDDDVFEETAPVAIASLVGEFPQHGAMAIDDEENAVWQEEGPPAVSNPNPSTLGPENHCLKEFLKEWAWRNRGTRYQPRRGTYPGIQAIKEQAAKKITRVKYSELEGDRCDMQGIDWEDLGVTRLEARDRRRMLYKNYTNRTDSDKWQAGDRAAWNVEDYFRFRRMHIRQNVHLAHFQLRNILACAGRSRAFYPGQRAIHQLNPVSGNSEVAMDLSDLGGVQISTLDARCGVLIAGTFNGEYCMRNIHSQDKKYTQGQITDHISGITNHLQIHDSRNSTPMAAFASNDQGFRVMDVATEKFVMERQYPCPINCTALSADRRLRVMVGDNYDVMIANADTGEIIRELDGHRDYGFACDWSDDGWTVATGFQDMSVKIWDARMWTRSDGSSNPLATIRSEMAGVRSLRFSPTGSGPPVLVAAEEADFVNIVNVKSIGHNQNQTFKQTIDVFGEIGGVEFSNDGQDLNILCMDRTRGGLVQLERCDMGSWDFTLAEEKTSRDAWRTRKRGAAYDDTSDRPTSPIQWSRKASVFDDLQPF